MKTHQQKHCPGLNRANLEALARSPSEEDISTDLPPTRQGVTLTTPVPKEEMVKLERELAEMRTRLTLIEEEVNLVCIS